MVITFFLNIGTYAATSDTAANSDTTRTSTNELLNCSMVEVLNGYNIFITII
jgi:hypothetical protein